MAFILVSLSRSAFKCVVNHALCAREACVFDVSSLSPGSVSRSRHTMPGHNQREPLPGLLWYFHFSKWKDLLCDQQLDFCVYWPHPPNVTIWKQTKSVSDGFTSVFSEKHTSSLFLLKKKRKNQLKSNFEKCNQV